MITDAGLARIAGLTQLQDLRLNVTNITNAGLAQLAGLTELQRLELNGTQVTDEGVKKIQQALPNCKILPLTRVPVIRLPATRHGTSGCRGEWRREGGAICTMPKVCPKDIAPH